MWLSLVPRRAQLELEQLVGGEQEPDGNLLHRLLERLGVRRPSASGWFRLRLETGLSGHPL